MPDILSSLNQMQKEAVLDFEHPLLVLAGAGSGKTRVITSKIAYAVNELGYKPYRILAVTFTNKAAKEMRDRIAVMIPDRDISGLEMRTFHSFGAYVLRRYGSSIGLNDSFSIYDDDDSLSLLQNEYPEKKKQDLREYAKEISKAKDRGYDPDSPVLSRVAERLDGFRDVYRRYEAALRRSGCVDFADLIIRTTELLESDASVREYFRSRFRLLLVDEYQDTNASQFRLLRTLVGPATQLVVVGDDDQSIYRFRGAEIRNILSFEDDYPETRIIKLEENYRSTKNILRIASSVIKNNKGRHEKTIFTNNTQGTLPELIPAINGDDEALKVAAIISRMSDRSSVAVLYRTNAQSREFETELARRRIPYQVIGALRFYDREEIKDVLALMSLIINPHDRVSFLRVINKPSRGIGKAAVETILSYSDHLTDSLDLAVRDGKLTPKAKKGASEFLSFMNRAGELLDTDLPLKDFAVFVMRESGIQGLYEDEKDPTVRKSRLENLSALVSAMTPYAPGRNGLIAFLETITLDRTTAGEEEDDLNSVKLMTMHNTKGLEFDTVFVTGLEDGIMPSLRDNSTDEDIEEERRLFYVAVTRARKQLYLTYASRRMLWGNSRNEDPSMFLKEIPNDYYKGDIYETKASYTSHYGFEPRTKISNTPSWAKNIALTPNKVRKPEPRPVSNADYQVGDRVKSPDYGTGEVVSREVRNGKTVIRVRFDKGNTALFNTAYASLTKC